MSALDLAEVEPARRAAVAHDAICASRKQWRREHRRPPALTAREAMAAAHFEAMLLWTAMSNHLAGVELSEEDIQRVTVAMRRIETIFEEFV